MLSEKREDGKRQCDGLMGTHRVAAADKSRREGVELVGKRIDGQDVANGTAAGVKGNV